MDFPPQRSLIKDFGSSFMDSLLLLNAQWRCGGGGEYNQGAAFGSEAVSSNQRSGFGGLTQLEVGDS